jgi:hypothetical protein
MRVRERERMRERIEGEVVRRGRERLSGKEERKGRVGFGRGLAVILLSRGGVDRTGQDKLES